MFKYGREGVCIGGSENGVDDVDNEGDERLGDSLVVRREGVEGVGENINIVKVG